MVEALVIFTPKEDQIASLKNLSRKKFLEVEERSRYQEEDCCPFLCCFCCPFQIVAVRSCLLMSGAVCCCPFLFAVCSCSSVCCWLSCLGFLVVVLPVGGPATGGPALAPPALVFGVSLRGHRVFWSFGLCVYIFPRATSLLAHPKFGANSW